MHVPYEGNGLNLGRADPRSGGGEMFQRFSCLVVLSLLLASASCSENPTHENLTEPTSRGAELYSGSSTPFEFESSLLGLPAAFKMSTGVLVRGVGGGGAPWVVAEGEAELDSDGDLEVEVEGLLITGTGGAADGTIGSVTDVAASLTCEGAGVVATTGVFPLSAAGDAEIEDEITIPSPCVGPIILIRIGATGHWIAASGF